jgi:hypothetical protein
MDVNLKCALLYTVNVQSNADAKTVARVSAVLGY